MAAAGSSRFAVTCGLMRQYMRDQQQQGGAAPRPPAVSLLAPPSDSEETDVRTMQLFPAKAVGLPLQPSQQSPEAQRKAPLTIFYDGRVLVFDDFPAEKAKALMQLAGSESSSSEPVKSGFYPTYTRSQSPSGPATTPQNRSSCGTLDFWRNSGNLFYKKKIEPNKNRSWGGLTTYMLSAG